MFNPEVDMLTVYPGVVEYYYMHFITMQTYHSKWMNDMKGDFSLCIDIFCFFDNANTRLDIGMALLEGIVGHLKYW